MAQPHILTGIDLGSAAVRVVVAQANAEAAVPTILGIGTVLAEGIQKGVVTDVDDAVKSLSRALDTAERIAGAEIDRAYVSINGSHISSQNSRGVIAVSRADGEITPEDVTRVINAAQAVSLPSNREIIHVLPQGFIVDGHEKIHDPIGMTGVRLEVETHMIEGSTPFIKNVTKVVNQSGVHVEDYVFAPLAAATVVLDKRQRELGVVLVDLGAGTSGMAVYEENLLLHTAVLPLGAAHITNDIAIGLRTSIDVAEEIKRQYGTALVAEVKENESIVVESDGEQQTESRKQVAEIIRARVDEIFSFVDRELQQLGRSGLLPAGIVFTGGGASLPGVVEAAKKRLRLPAHVAWPKQFEGTLDQAGDPAFATAFGLVLWALEQEEASPRHRLGGRVWRLPDMRRARGWFKHFLP
ncbi:MAG: cell division protein FtsA [Candidatus Andersenbacteria bacterium CG10_big_fil_rev_8_21_14_0_10_54_11]|uniref:Cell division protein FtsA n=1 Tax=Candidatus Andersenbacteria bacterium CG10_big_fil_rev_8_21_14_0_10_54_11 TaxID=1974485 RepID=A0A2M6X0F1_9BACT|nr:MAG: cell division protein FtsA [Candidatus Andersenbacteria bacterium CG10_big_fil_rev_8_21_14_0_10_54_11]